MVSFKVILKVQQLISLVSQKLWDNTIYKQCVYIFKDSGVCYFFQIV